MTCSIIFCEAVAIYGVIVAIILQTKLDYVDQLPNGLWPTAAYTAGYAIFASGLTTGWANLSCGYGLTAAPCACIAKTFESIWLDASTPLSWQAAQCVSATLSICSVCKFQPVHTLTTPFD